jgi:hypothetical protein
MCVYIIIQYNNPPNHHHPKSKRLKKKEERRKNIRKRKFEKYSCKKNDKKNMKKMRELGIEFERKVGSRSVKRREKYELFQRE